jgi:hypothetical protein
MYVIIYRKNRNLVTMTAQDGYPIEIMGDKAIRSISDRLHLRHGECVGLAQGSQISVLIPESLWDKEHKLVR